MSQLSHDATGRPAAKPKTAELTSANPSIPGSHSEKLTAKCLVDVRHIQELLMRRVLIVSNSEDEHANYVSQKLAGRGVSLARFNTEALPRSARVVVSNENSELRLAVGGQDGKQIFSAGEISSVWYRRPFFEEFAHLIREEEKRFAIKEHEAMLENVWALLGSATWVNPREASRKANNKLFQLTVARSMGFRVPNTLVTNDPEEAREFVQRHREVGVVYKTMSDPVISQEGREARCVYTTRIEWSERVAASVETVACLLQEYVEKAYELRIAVVGNKVFAARIYSQDAEQSKVDWRRGVVRGELRQEVEPLEPEIADRCIELVRVLGLRFGAIDMVREPSGQHVFLEVNPNGQWLWMEMLLGLPIADALVEILARGMYY